MEFRKAEERDLMAIKEVANLLYLDMPNFIWNTEGFINKQIAGGNYFVAEDKGKIVAGISFRNRKDRMYIESLVVAPDFQSNGVGKKLIEFAKNFAKGKGFKILRVCSFYEYKAVDFYVKQGFKKLKIPGIYNGHMYHRFEAFI